MRRLRSGLDLELIRFLPSAGVVAVWTVLMANAGGFRPESWMPAGLVLLGLLVVSVIGQRRLLPTSRTARAALLVLIAFTAWCFLSILWSDAAGTTWEAADLLLVTLLGAWTLVLAPWRTRSADLLMGALSLAAAIVCLIVLLSALGADDLTSRFDDLRFTPPLDYPNTTAAFGFMAAIPALMLATRPELPIVVKALAQGLATFLCAFALLPQSRGSILGGVAALAILAVASPFRWRLAAHGALLALTMVIANGPASNVLTEGLATGRAAGALQDATRAILLIAGAAVLGGALLSVAEARIELSDRARGRARHAGMAACALVAAGAIALVGTHSASLSGTLHDQWRSLSHPGVKFGGKAEDAQASRLSSTDPLERYDYWRVSLGGFGAAPLGGMGAGGFEHRYTLERRYPKPSRYPHNVVMKVLGDTGLIGAALVLGLMAIIALGLLRGRRTTPGPQRAVAAVALAVLGYFVAHGLFDWLEAYPVLVGPALALPLVALVVVRPPEPAVARRAGLPRGVWAVAALATVLVAGSLLAPWFALRYRERASVTWRATPALAYADLRRAADVNPLGAEAPILEGVIGLARGDLAVARRGFTEALGREETWLPHFGLAVIDAAGGDQAAAKAELARARRLNRLDPVLADVARRIVSGKRIVPADLIRDVLVSPYVTTERVA